MVNLPVLKSELKSELKSKRHAAPKVKLLATKLASWVCVAVNLLLALPLTLSVTLISVSGYAAACSIPKSYYKHVSCTNDGRYFLAVTNSGAPVALLNKAGKKMVDLSRYQKVATDKIADGVLPVQRGNKVGYVNMQGREIVPAVYDILLDEVGTKGWARAASDGRIVVKKNGNYGVITTTNKVILPFAADITAIGDYRAGRVQVSRASKGVLWYDKQGKLSNNTSNNPSVAKNISSEPDNGQSTPLSKPKPVSPPFTTLYPHQQDGRWGFVDDNDVTMITYSFDEVMPFSEGLAGVRIADNWGFVNLGGELVIPFRFDDAGVIKTDRYQGVKPFMFKEGKAWVGNLKNGAKICIDKDGTNVSCD